MNSVKNIEISKKLREVLLQFADNSAIARTLLQDEVSNDQLKKSDINYLCVSSIDKSKISYLTTDRLQKIEPQEIWTSPKRYHQKPGGLISKIFKNFTSKEVENFSNLFRAFADKKEFEFDIISGESLKRYYHEDSYNCVSGSLGNSCMRYSRCSKYFDFYVENDIKMLIMTSPDGSLLGRALLWECEGHKIMDRIYTVNDEDFMFYFTHWADSNGHYYKKRQNWSSTLQFIKNGEQVELMLKYKLKKSTFSYYPYVDTFKWIDFEEGYLYNYKPEHFSNNLDYGVLLSSEGSINKASCLQFDSITKDWHHDGNLVWISYREFYTQPCNTFYSETNDMHIIKSDAIWSEEFQDYIFSDFTKNDQESLNSRIEQLGRRHRTESEILSIADSLNIDREIIQRLLRCEELQIDDV